MYGCVYQCFPLTYENKLQTSERRGTRPTQFCLRNWIRTMWRQRQKQNRKRYQSGLSSWPYQHHTSHFLLQIHNHTTESSSMDVATYYTTYYFRSPIHNIGDCILFHLEKSQQILVTRNSKLTNINLSGRQWHHPLLYWNVTPLYSVSLWNITGKHIK